MTGAGGPMSALDPETAGRLRAHAGGRMIRSTWLLTPSSDGVTPWPRVQVAYAHLDRFLLLATAGCGESAVASEAELP